MGNTLLSQALTEVQFNKRIEYLKENRLPITMKNIDPELYKCLNASGLKMCILHIFAIIITFSFAVVFLLRVL